MWGGACYILLKMVSHQEPVVCVVNRKLGFDTGTLRVNAIHSLHEDTFGTRF